MSNEIELKETCGACSEQYNAFLDGKQVGYLRLRHGIFRVHCPDVGGTVVYYTETAGDGSFEDHERAHHLREAKEAIRRWVEKQDHAFVGALDRCHFCAGRRGGVRGNENIVHGLTICDYCHADIIKVEREVRDHTLRAAIRMAKFSHKIAEGIAQGDKAPALVAMVAASNVAEGLESVRLTPDGRWKSDEAMRLWGQMTDFEGERLHEEFDGNGRPRHHT